MDFKRISGQAKRLIDQRGGSEALKKDLDELKTIARSEGSLGDKAKKAADALKDPGKRERTPQSTPVEREPAVDAEPTTPPATGETPGAV
jgi:hypothetical protein